MALIECPECGKQISEQASVCPNCGFKVSKYKTKKNIENAFDTLKTRKAHINKPSLKEMFDLGESLEFFQRIPIIGTAIWAILIMLILLVGMAVFIAALWLVLSGILLLMEVNVILGYVVFGIFLLVVNYFVWYKDRRTKFWVVTILIVISLIALAWTTYTI